MLLLLPEGLFVLFLIWHQPATGNDWTKPKIDLILGLLRVPRLSENRGSAGIHSLGSCVRENSRWILKLPWVTWLQGENSTLGNWKAPKVKSSAWLSGFRDRACETFRLLLVSELSSAALSAQMMTAAEIQRTTFPGFPEAFLGTVHLPSSRGGIIFRGLLGKSSLKGSVFKICVWSSC